MGQRFCYATYDGRHAGVQMLVTVAGLETEQDNVRTAHAA